MYACAHICVYMSVAECMNSKYSALIDGHKAALYACSRIVAGIYINYTSGVHYYCMLLFMIMRFMFFPSAQSIVQDVIQRGVAQGGQIERSSDDHWLKVCGRDEYLDP